MSTTLKTVASKNGNVLPRTVEDIIGKVYFSFNENCHSACKYRILNFPNYGNQDKKDWRGAEHEVSQLTFTFSKSITSLTSFWCFDCYLWTYFTPSSSVSIVDFEQVNVSQHRRSE